MSGFWVSEDVIYSFTENGFNIDLWWSCQDTTALREPPGMKKTSIPRMKLKKNIQETWRQGGGKPDIKLAASAATANTKWAMETCSTERPSVYMQSTLTAGPD